MTSVTTGASTYYNGNTAFCDLACATQVGCISYTITGTNCQLYSTMQLFISDSTSKVYITHDFRLVKPAQLYYEQNHVDYIGFDILNLSGNIAYCSIACDVLPNCVGFVADSVTMCNLKSVMNITNYVQNSSRISMVLSPVDARAVNIKINPTVPGMALKYIGCFEQGSPSILAQNISTAGYLP